VAHVFEANGNKQVQEVNGTDRFEGGFNTKSLLLFIFFAPAKAG
jgi:hypothetical protein